MLSEQLEQLGAGSGTLGGIIRTDERVKLTNFGAKFFRIYTHGDHPFARTGERNHRMESV